MSASEVVGLDRELATAQKSHDVTADASRLGQPKNPAPTNPGNALLLARDGHMANRTQLEAEGPLVDVEMRSQLEEAKTRRSEGESDLRATKAAIERLDEKLSDLKIDTNLLDQQEKVEKLTSQTGGYEEKEEDLPGLKVRGHHQTRTGTARQEAARCVSTRRQRSIGSHHRPAGTNPRAGHRPHHPRL